MSGTLQRPRVVGHDRLNLAADAFLCASVLLLLGFGLQEVILLAFPPGPPDTPGSPLVEAVGTLALVVSVVGGTLLAWRLHGGTLHGRDLGAAALGILAGAVAAGALFGLVRLLLRFAPRLFPPDEGPWELGIVAALAVVALLAKPLVDAVTDLVGGRDHPVIDLARILGTVVLVVAVVVSIVQGGESAELGLWLAVLGGAAAFAVLGMSLRR